MHLSIAQPKCGMVVSPVTTSPYTRVAVRCQPLSVANLTFTVVDLEGWRPGYDQASHPLAGNHTR
jgi:hypothetical protein